MGLKWTDRLAIAEELYDARPEQHPLKVRFEDLHGWVTALDDFDDAPDQSSEGLLESIQMAWWDEYLVDHPHADPYG